MSPAEPAAAGDFAGDALHDAIVAGLLIPIFQQILLELFNAFPETAIDASTTLVFVVALVTMGLLPTLTTVVSIAAAYAMGGVIGAGLYVVMSVAASAVLGNPLMGMLVLLVATLAMAVWLFVQASTRSRPSHRGFR